MLYTVNLTRHAEIDLIELWTFIADNDCFESADYVIDSIEAIIMSLAELPERGHIPPELDRISVQGYYEVHFKPYRIIYTIDSDNVNVFGVLDGRRDIQTILQKRVLC